MNLAKVILRNCRTLFLISHVYKSLYFIAYDEFETLKNINYIKKTLRLI